MCARALAQFRQQARSEKANQRVFAKAEYHANCCLMQEALEHWVELGQEWRQTQDDYKDAVLHWAEIELIAAADKWRMVAWQASAGGQAMVSSLSAWRATHTYMALSTWRDWARWMRNEEQTEGLGVMAAIDHERLSKMTHVMDRLRDLGDNQFEGRMMDAEQIWRSRAMDTVFCRWRDYTYFFYELQEMMAQASFRFYHRCLSDIFTRWRSHERGVRLGRKPGSGAMVDPLDRDFEAQFDVQLRG